VLLTAALITRDEAHFLPDCLAALAGVVDEIVVVDTGSRDATPSIARSFGAVVVDHPWHGDFAEARNAGLALARGEWILYIDADERFSVHGDLKATLAESDVVAGLVRFRSATAFTEYLEYRLFRNRPDVRFRGAIHETIMFDLDRVIASEGARAVPMPASITHLGYEGDQTAKHRRNLPLLERSVLEYPERTYLWLHLGAIRLAIGDPAGADDAWSHGVAVTRARGSMNGPAMLTFVDLALHRVRSGRSAADLVADLELFRPDDPLTSWAKAHQAMFEQRWADAVPLLEALLDIDLAELSTEVGYNRSIFGSFAAHALGSCRFHLGDFAEAAELFGRAEAADPTNPEYRVKRELAEARAGRG
jgi:tetratricopeptide (TPR) repeat protein